MSAAFVKNKKWAVLAIAVCVMVVGFLFAPRVSHASTASAASYCGQSATQAGFITGASNTTDYINTCENYYNCGQGGTCTDPATGAVQNTAASYCGAQNSDLTSDQCTAIFNAGKTSATTPPPTAPTANNTCGLTNPFGCVVGGLLTVINLILTLIESIIAGFLGLAGMLLDSMISYSITNLATKLSTITGINTTWQLIRDLCNMSFIFILVYNGIMIMFGKGNKKIIVSVIIAAVLINFSLFFTKVIIDASNVVAVSFYNAVAPTSRTQVTIGPATINPGLSSVFMQQLNLSSLYSTNILTADPTKATVNLITVLGGSLMMLIAMFIFLAMAVLFLVRYLVFIFLLILSPVGYMSSVIPGLQKLSKQYWDTLIGQALFAPIFMIMIYIVLVLISSFNLGVNADIGQALTTPTSTLLTSAILPYILIAGFLIGTIVISKSFATKGGVASGALVNKVTGFAGGALFGGAAFAGRQTIGRVADTISKNEKFKEYASTSSLGKFAMDQTNKVASSTFDARKTGTVKSFEKVAGIDTGKGLPFNEKAGEGGFKGTQKAKKEDKESRIDNVTGDYIKKKQWDKLASYMHNTLDEKERQYVYGKLSARDRVALDEELARIGATGAAMTATMRGKLTLEEREKTEEQEKKSKAAASMKKKLEDIEALVASGTGTPAQYDALFPPGGLNMFPVKAARELSNDALNDPEVIKRLSAKHLGDIINNPDNLDQTTQDRIVSLITGSAPGTLGTPPPPLTTPLWPLHLQQYNYMTKGNTATLWGV